MYKHMFDLSTFGDKNWTAKTWGNFSTTFLVLSKAQNVDSLMWWLSWIWHPWLLGHMQYNPQKIVPYKLSLQTSTHSIFAKQNKAALNRWIPLIKSEGERKFIYKHSFYLWTNRCMYWVALSHVNMFQSDNNKYGTLYAIIIKFNNKRSEISWYNMEKKWGNVRDYGNR